MTKTTEIYSFTVQWLRSLAQSHWAKIRDQPSFLEAQGENPFPCLFQLLETTHIPPLTVLFLYLQRQQLLHFSEHSSIIIAPHPWLSLLPPSALCTVYSNLVWEEPGVSLGWARRARSGSGRKRGPGLPRTRSRVTASISTCSMPAWWCSWHLIPVMFMRDALMWKRMMVVTQKLMADVIWTNWPVGPWVYSQEDSISDSQMAHQAKIFLKRFFGEVWNVAQLILKFVNVNRRDYTH